MSDQNALCAQLEQLMSAAPAGFALGMHVAFTAPRFLFQTYPRAWLDHYTEHGFIMDDPTVLWAFETTGVARWSDLTGDDHLNIMGQARDFGLKFGMVVSLDAAESRSICSFARADREYTDAEMNNLQTQAALLHQTTAAVPHLTQQTMVQLKALKIHAFQAEKNVHV